ncbi:hypothetical protein [Latilactobacillus fragifolii]|uniref:hypothetical protein n=1 Tax=Latilactobacillus fragifolii TaxID=2814244 RepID=UPI001ABA7DE1|nr:hypothetical protein [Latilactobacillus fragifolii]
MWQLIGVNSGKEYKYHREKEALYRFMMRQWPTKSRGYKSKSYGGAMLKNRMPEPMIIRRVK